MPIPPLPQELIHHVIEQGCDDRTALAEWSLVCRAWRPTSQRLLFYSLLVDMSRRTLDELLVSFSAAGDQALLALCVRHLTLRSAGKNETVGTVTLDDLPKVLLCFPNLSTLTLEALRLTLAEDCCTPTDRELARLSLKDVTVQRATHEQLIEWASVLCKPAALHLSNISFTEGAEPDPLLPAKAAPDTITTLVVRMRAMPPSLLPMFARAGALRRLDVACYTPGDVRALGTFLAGAGGTLEHFALDLSRFLAKAPTTHDEDLRRLALDGCGALRALTLRVTFLADPWASLPFNATGLRVAEQVLMRAPPALRALTLALALDGDVSSHEAFRRPLEACFPQRFAWLRTLPQTHPALREVRWIWSYARKAGKPRAGPVDPVLKRSLSDLVVAGLPELHSMGMLEFIESDEEIWG